MDPIFGAIQQNLDSALSVPFVSSSVMLGLAFYAYKAAPELPSFIEELFNHVFFQIFVGFMVLYMGTRDFMLSLVVSVVFVYGMKMLSGLKEGMFGGGFDFSGSVPNTSVYVPNRNVKPPGTFPSISGPPSGFPSPPSPAELQKIIKDSANTAVKSYRKNILDDARNSDLTKYEKE